MPNPELPNIDWEKVKQQIADYQDFANKLTPIVNKAHAAFGGLEPVQTQLQQFKDNLAKAKAALNSG